MCSSDLAPGRLESWGLDYARLAGRDPGVIVVHVSGFGQTGPRAGDRGFGSVGEAMGGLRGLAGVPDRRANPRLAVEPDRGAAVRLALDAARPGDVVVIAGKGHETYQEVSGQRLPFDDAVEARRALSLRFGSDPGTWVAPQGPPARLGTVGPKRMATAPHRTLPEA